MHFLRSLRFRLRAVLRRRSMDAEIDDELAFHIDAHIADQMDRGLPEAAARREALRRFGGVARIKEEVREAQGVAWSEALRQDLAHALRTPRRAPGFAVMVALTLGVAIGANAAMFGIIDHLMLRGPAHVVRDGELRRVYVRMPDGSGGHHTSPIQPYVLYTLLRDHVDGVTGAAAYTPGTMRIGEGPDARSVPIAFATADFFPLLGVRPALGRFFSVDEDRPPRGENVAVLGHEFWRREVGADSTVLGRRVRLSGREFTVVGVAPRGFTGTERGVVDVWIPMSARSLAVAADWPVSWNSRWVRIVGRLAPEATEEIVGEQATSLLRANYAGFDLGMREADLIARPISYGLEGNEPPEMRVARLLFGVAIVMTLIAGANTANLLLARVLGRRREIAIRLALGGGRQRLARMLLAEAAGLAVLGGCIGAFVAYWGGGLARTMLFPSVAWDSNPADARVLTFTFAAVVVTALLVGALPAFRASTVGFTEALTSGSRQAGHGAEHRRSRVILQGGQIALSVVLLFVAGAFARSLLDARALDLGVEPDRVLTAGMALPRPDGAGAADPRAEERRRYQEVLERVQAMPGVEAAALAVGSPFGSSFWVTLRVPGRDTILPGTATGPFINAVSPGYFETVGTPLRRGRLFTTGDRQGSERVVIVNETMARRVWSGEDALGKCLLIGSTECGRVIGIVADARKERLREDPVMQYYVPFGQERGIGGTVLLVRPRGDATAFTQTLRNALLDLVPGVRSLSVNTMASQLDPELRPWRVGTRMFGFFGLAALVVAAIGLFSVVSYVVEQRRHELGVRIALGAPATRIAGLVLGGAVMTAAAGIAIGAGLAYGLAPLLQPYLFENAARDPGVLAIVTVVLLACTLAASAVPCLRACRVDPLTALRVE